MGLNFGQDFEILKLKFSCSFEVEVLVDTRKLPYGPLHLWKCFRCVCVCVPHTNLKRTVWGEKIMTMTLYQYFQQKNFESVLHQ